MNVLVKRLADGILFKAPGIIVVRGRIRTCFSVADHLRVLVCDDGCGIAPDVLPCIREKQGQRL